MSGTPKRLSHFFVDFPDRSKYNFPCRLMGDFCICIKNEPNFFLIRYKILHRVRERERRKMMTSREDEHPHHKAGVFGLAEISDRLSYLEIWRGIWQPRHV